MNGYLTEINVEQARVRSIQNSQQRFEFDPRDLPRFVEQLTEPETPQEMGCWFRHDVNGLKWKRFGVLPLLRDNERTDTSEAGDLPVDVRHLRLEKCRAVGCDRWLLISGIQPAMLNSEIFASKRRTSDIESK